MKRISIILFALSLSIPLFAQTLEATLVDSHTKLPVTKAFVFISNSSIGAETNKDGIFILDRSYLRSSDIVISHISYETKYLTPNQVSQDLDTIYLNPLLHKIEEVVLKSKDPKKRKNWLKKIHFFYFRKI